MTLATWEKQKQYQDAYVMHSIQNYSEVLTWKLSRLSASNRLSGSGKCRWWTKVELLASGATDSSIQYFRRQCCTLNKGRRTRWKGQVRGDTEHEPCYGSGLSGRKQTHAILTHRQEGGGSVFTPESAAALPVTSGRSRRRARWWRDRTCQLES